MLLEMELICLELLCQKNYIASRKGKEEGRKSVELHSWSSQYTRESSLAIHSNLILSQ